MWAVDLISLNSCTPDVVGTMTDDPELSVAGMKDCSEIYKLFQCFDKLGLTKREKELIARENFTRVLERDGRIIPNNTK